MTSEERIEAIATSAVFEASGGPMDYVRKARDGNWPIWRAAYLAASAALKDTNNQEGGA